MRFIGRSKNGKLAVTTGILLAVACLTITGIILFSGPKGVHLHFLYSDGSEIKDSTQITFILEEFDSLDIDLTEVDGPIKIHTSLKSAGNYLELMDSLRTEYCSHLRANNPDHSALLEQYSPAHYMNMELIITDNETGKIVKYQKQNSSNYQDCHPLRYDLNLYVHYLFALEKEYAPDDLFQAFEPFNVKIYNSEKQTVDYWSNDGKRSIVSMFNYIPGGSIPALPTQKYTFAEWKNFEHSKEIELPLFYTSKDFDYHVGIGFLDLFKLFSSHQNKGIARFPLCIDKIADDSGRLVYSRIQRAKKILDSQTNDEMLYMLKSATHEGKSRFLTDSLDLRSDEILYWFRIANGIGGFHYANPKVSIGLYLYGSDYLPSAKVSGYLRVDYPYKFPKYYIPLLREIVKTER